MGCQARRTGAGVGDSGTVWQISFASPPRAAPRRAGHHRADAAVDTVRGLEDNLVERAGQFAAQRQGRRRGQRTILRGDPDHLMDAQCRVNRISPGRASAMVPGPVNIAVGRAEGSTHCLEAGNQPAQAGVGPVLVYQRQLGVKPALCWDGDDRLSLGRGDLPG